MSQFTDSTSIRPVAKTHLWRTTGEIVWYLDYENSGLPVVIPEGYEFDWASVPSELFVFFLFLWWVHSPLWLLLGVFGILIQRTEAKTIAPAVLHDFIYTDRPYNLSLSDADRIFREALIACDVPKWKAWSMWLWVRLWWWFYWYKVKNLFLIAIRWAK